MSKIKGRKAGEHEIIGLDEPGIPNMPFKKRQQGCIFRAIDLCKLRIRARGSGKTPYCTERACPLKLND